MITHGKKILDTKEVIPDIAKAKKIIDGMLAKMTYYRRYTAAYDSNADKRPEETVMTYKQLSANELAHKALKEERKEAKKKAEVDNG